MKDKEISWVKAAYFVVSVDGYIMAMSKLEDDAVSLTSWMDGERIFHITEAAWEIVKRSGSYSTKHLVEVEDEKFKYKILVSPREARRGMGGIVEPRILFGSKALEDEAEE